MARSLYAGRPGDTVLSRFLMGDGRILVGVPATPGGTPATTTLTVWDVPDGTQYTDLLAADGVTPITELTVPAGEIQIPAFYAPDGVEGELWLRDPEGDYTRLDVGPPGPAGTPGADGEVTTAAMNAAISAAIANLINGAPGALDQLNELAAAMGNDANFATTVTNALAGKVPTSRTIATGTGLTGGGDLSANRTLAADPEFIRDTIAAALVEGTGIDITVNDAGDTITIAATGGGGGSALLAAASYNPASVDSKSTTSTTFVAVDSTRLRAAFTAPASVTHVIVRLTGYMSPSGGAYGFWGLLTSGGAVVAGSEAVLDNELGRKHHSFRLDVTPGASYTWDWAHRCGAGSVSVAPGATNGAALMEVWSA